MEVAKKISVSNKNDNFVRGLSSKEEEKNIQQQQENIPIKIF